MSTICSSLVRRSQNVHGMKLNILYNITLGGGQFTVLKISKPKKKWLHHEIHAFKTYDVNVSFLLIRKF